MTPPDGAGGRRRASMVRPYALTGGRTRSSGEDLPLETLIQTTELGQATGRLTMERARIAALCLRPLSIAEVSAHLRVPLGVARVLVGDMTGEGLVRIHQARVATERPDLKLLERVLDGLSAL